MEILKTKSELKKSFDEWFKSSHPHLDRNQFETGLMSNLCGMIRVVAEEAYLRASEPYSDDTKV